MVVLDDLPGDGQAQSVADPRGKLRSPVERLEQSRQIVAGYTRTTVLDTHADFSSSNGHLDAHPAALRRMRQGIAQQVVENAVQHFRITADDAGISSGERANVEFHATAGLRGFRRRVGNDVGQ